MEHDIVRPASVREVSTAYIMSILYVSKSHQQDEPRTDREDDTGHVPRQVVPTTADEHRDLAA
jgi:hypothetical protein